MKKKVHKGKLNNLEIFSLIKKAFDNHHKIKKIIIWSFLGLIGLLSLILIIYHLTYWHKIYPGIEVAQQPLGNKTKQEGRNILEGFLQKQTVAQALIFNLNEQQFKINLEELGFHYDLDLAVNQAYQIGRSGDEFQDLKDKINCWFKNKNLNLAYQLEQDLLEEKVATIASQVFIPAIEPEIKIDKTNLDQPQIIIESGKDGQELDKRQFLKIINQELASLQINDKQLPVIHISPSLRLQQIEETKARAEKFLNKKLILTTPETTWQWEDNDLIQLLSFTNGFDQDKIASWSANLATSVNRSPENASFQFNEGRVTEFRPAKNGQKLEEQKTVDLIAQNLAKLENEADKKELTVSLPLVVTPPAVKTADVNTLGIKELLGHGVSYFKGSIASRIENIKLASSRLNGILIPPDETFSFNQSLGEVSQSTGYKEAYIIKDGKTVLGDGGGVCQVSTTLFRAALKTGLPIVERRAHAYRVSYYEQNSQVGMDATVFSPSTDFKFKNDTPGYLLIQTSIDVPNRILFFDIYGTNDGRQVTVSQSRIWDQSPPPPDLYQDDPTLPTGTVRQIDWKAWGAKVSFDYQVKRGGETLQNQTFYSNYKPWQAIFLKGTGPN